MIWSQNPCPCCGGTWWLKLASDTGGHSYRAFESDYLRLPVVDMPTAVSKSHWGKSWAFFDLCLGCGVVVS